MTKNRFCGALLITIGVLVMFIFDDITVLLFLGIIGLYLLLSRD